MAEEAYFQSVCFVKCPMSPRAGGPASDMECDGWRDSDEAGPVDDE